MNKRVIAVIFAVGLALTATSLLTTASLFSQEQVSNMDCKWKNASTNGYTFETVEGLADYAQNQGGKFDRDMFEYRHTNPGTTLQFRPAGCGNQ